jgi:ubiquinone/menaquinone biosynthesis C-methylase UbiE
VEKANYIHGYSSREGDRLVDQATTLTELLHGDTAYPAGSTVLEAGCGVGAQTVILAGKNPGAQITSVDISEDSLKIARDRVCCEGIKNVSFRQADLYNLPFVHGTFDHVFVCFVLEHLSRPLEALSKLKAVVKPGGTITAIEGDHGSVYFHPENSDARRVIQCLIDIQARSGGNSLIGRQLYPLLITAGFSEVRVSPRMVYADASRPQMVEGFTKKTFTAMVQGVGEQAVALGMIDGEAWRKGIEALYRTAENDGTFCYTFFKATGVKSQ